jgi:hypothetical protein
MNLTPNNLRQEKTTRDSQAVKDLNNVNSSSAQEITLNRNANTSCKIKFNNNSIAPSHFYLPKDYAEARTDFLEAATKLNAEICSIPISALGSKSEQLFIDFARIGSAQAEKVFFNLSGVHGVEGFIGSAIQREALLALPIVPENTALYFCHALNPYGMAYLRRVNENNIDLNRNYFVDQAGYARINTDYGNLFSFLNPNSLFPGIDLCYLSSAFQIAKAGGIGPIKRALTLGQYEFPQGLYYGGKKKQENLLILENYLKQEWQSAKQIIAVETHTGLGDYGESTIFVAKDSNATLMSDIQNRSQNFKFEIEKAGGNEVGVETAGAICDAMCNLFPDRKILWLTQEIGTYNNIAVFKALRAENVFYRQGENDPGHWSKVQLKNTFTPNDQKWQIKAMEDGLKLMRDCFELE